MEVKNTFTNGMATLVDELGKSHPIYILLYDPIKLHAVSRAHLLIAAIKLHMPMIKNEKARKELNAIMHEEAKVITTGISGFIDSDIDPCGTRPPRRFRFPGPKPGPIDPRVPKTDGTPMPAYEGTPMYGMDAKNTLTVLGKHFGNERLVEVAAGI